MSSGEDMEDWEQDLEEDVEARKEEEKAKKEKEKQKLLEIEINKKMKQRKIQEKKEKKFQKVDQEEDERPVVLTNPRLLGFYKRYNVRLNESREVEEFLGTDFDVPIRVDLLEPRNELEYYECGRLLCDIIVGQYYKKDQHNHYLRFVKYLVEQSVSPLNKKDLREVLKVVSDTIAGNGAVRSGGKIKNLMGSKSKHESTDDFLEIASQERKKDGDADEDSSAYDSDEDFM